MLKRLPAYGSVALLSLVLLAACGGGGGETTPTTAPSKPTATKGAATPTKPAGVASPAATPKASPAATRGTPAASPAASPASSAAGALTVTSFDIRFEPTTLTIPANEEVTISLPNKGAIAHNFSIDALNISIDEPPGSTEEAKLTAAPGEYQYYCNVPGHKEAGMVGTLTAE